MIFRQGGGARATLLCLLLAALIVGCGSMPPRPDTVPAGAFWVGGSDGGVFVQLAKEPSDPDQVYRAKIYYEKGELWYEGTLTLEPPNGPPVDIANAEAFSGWDGTQLILADGRTLRKAGQ